MSFPQTRHTLILRLVDGQSEGDWQEFLNDYWGPICRFALRRGAVTLATAEDLASQCFEVVIRNKLLERWVSSRQAKLRTLLCSVVCKLQANEFRATRKKGEFERKLAEELLHTRPTSSADVDTTFFAAWAEELLQQTLRTMAREYHAAGKGNYFRVLYGRICEELSIAETATALGISTSDVDNYYRHARKRLNEQLEAAVRSHVARYCDPDEVEQEFAAEWDRLGEYLRDHGGLETAIRQGYEFVERESLEAHKPTRIRETLTKIPFNSRDSS